MPRLSCFSVPWFRLCCPWFALCLAAQGPSPCDQTPIFTPCDLAFPLTAQEAGRFTNPYKDVVLQAEFRSPRGKTLLVLGYWDGGTRMVLRFAPNEPGEWTYKLSGNTAAATLPEGRLTALDAPVAGHIFAANTHHWATIATLSDQKKPHLWSGDAQHDFAFLTEPEAQSRAAALADTQLTHLRASVLGASLPQAAQAYASPDQPRLEHFQRLDANVKALHARGIAFDLQWAHAANQLNTVFPTAAQRERYLRYLVARYAAFNITWAGVEAFETYTNGRELLKETGNVVKRLDPYQHPRSTHAQQTSSPLLADQWMTHVFVGNADPALLNIEHQLYPVPFVYAPANLPAEAAQMARQVWQASTGGAYITLPKAGQTPATLAVLRVWRDQLAAMRYWELEPHFDVDGAFASALPGVEYLAYTLINKTIELGVEKHEYQIAWLNPVTGERQAVKETKTERYTPEPPGVGWVLHLAREGRKEGMLKSYKFESRYMPFQEPEQAASRIPYTMVSPGEEMKAGAPLKLEAKITRASRGTRNMLFLWTGEVFSNGQSFRVLGTGPTASAALPEGWMQTGASVLNVRVAALNAYGKLYSLDRVVRLIQ